jgi:AcrR family transcriptional regulator
MTQNRVNPAANEERRSLIYELALDGMTIRQIARQLSMSVATVHREFREAVAEIPPTERAELRAVADDRFSRWTLLITDEIKGGGDVAELIKVGLAIEAQRARLFGLNDGEADNRNIATIPTIKLELAEIVAAAERQAQEQSRADADEVNQGKA